MLKEKGALRTRNKTPTHGLMAGSWRTYFQIEVFFMAGVGWQGYVNSGCQRAVVSSEFVHLRRAATP